MSPTPDYAASLDFLRKFHPGRRWTLTAIARGDEKPPTITATFDAARESACLSWLQEHGQTRDLYFAVNPPAFDVSKKTERTDIQEVVAFHADLDPRRERELASERARLLRIIDTATPQPTCIVDSGRGFWCHWLLSEPLPVNRDLNRAERAKAYNADIANKLNADTVCNIDRIARLPGTINRKTGELATAPKWNLDASGEPVKYKATDVANPPKEQVRNGEYGDMQGVGLPNKSNNAPYSCNAPIGRLDSIDNLPRKLRKWVKTMIRAGYDPANPDKEIVKGFNEDSGKKGIAPTEKPYPSRSEATYATIGYCKFAGVSDGILLNVLSDDRWGISAHCRDNKGESYARRQIENWRNDHPDFSEQGAIVTSDDGLKLNSDGKVIVCRHNVDLVIERLGIQVRYDEFADYIVVDGLPHDHNRVLDDKSATPLCIDFAEKFSFYMAQESFDRYILDHALRHRFNPVVDYFNAREKEWDGERRIEKWLIDHAGAEDTPLNREISKLILIAAVRRARHPGSKWDEMIVLESKEGLNKSTALRILTPDEEWFTDDFPLDVDTKRQMEALENKLIIECGELKGMKRAEVGALKSLLSRTEDRARLSYGRRNTTRKRRCVFFGTTNDAKYLPSTTGNRRFWPVKITGFDLDKLKANKAQLWAEAAHVESRWTGDVRLAPHFYAVAAKEQDKRFIENQWWEILAPLFEDESVNGKIQSDFIWAAIGKGNPKLRTQQDFTLVGDCMRKMGWENSQCSVLGRRQSCYARGNAEQRSQILWLDKRSDGWHVCGVPDGCTRADYDKVLGLFDRESTQEK
jgi:hypothetical protein